MDQRYGKTEAGRREIKERSPALSRTARNLLLILDTTRTGVEWVGLVQGASLADLQTLIDSGLIGPTQAQAPVAAGAPAPGAPRRASSGNTVPGALPASLPVSNLPYDQLYGSLNALVKEQLGLIKGYRFSLKVEQASNVAELTLVALSLIEEVRQAKGQDAAQMVYRALGFGR